MDLRSMRWWVLGIVAGLAGWAIWASLERSPEGPLAFERQFWPERLDKEPAAAPPKAGDTGTALPATVPARTDYSAPMGGLGEELSASAPVAGSEASPGPKTRMNPDSFRAERERLRSREMELANQVLQDPSASEQRKSQAQLELVQLLQRSRRELEVEELLKAAGVEDPVVSIGEAGVQVVVAQPLSAQHAARIGELVARMAGVRRENISIIDSITAFAPAAGLEESPAAR